MSAMLPAFTAALLAAAPVLPATPKINYEVHTLIDQKFPGEIKNSRGFVAALRDRCDIEQVPFTEVSWVKNENTFKSINTYLRNALATSEYANSKIILYITNTNGLEIFNKLAAEAPDIMPRIITIWCGHQYITGLSTLAGKINMICLPRHALRILTDPQINSLKHPATILVTDMRGVPHNVTRESVQEEYLAWTKDTTLPAIPSAEKYIGVVLGGDAPDMAGKMHCFTVDEARVLAKHVARQANAKGATVLITNHQRTGLHDPETLKKLPLHLEGETYTEPTDAVSKAFIAELDQAHAHYVFFNIAQGLKSAYLAILGAITMDPFRMVSAYITGESTSMVSEMSAIIPWLKLNVVQVGSMSEAHLAHMQDEIDCAAACGIRPNFNTGLMEEIPIDHTVRPNPAEPAAQAIVKALQPLLAPPVAAVASARPVVTV